MNDKTLTNTLIELKAKGYQEDFSLKQNCLECRESAYKIFHDEFRIDEVFRFDVDTDPGDQAILYAISSEKYGLKGTLVNGYGIYTEALSNEMLEKLRR
jgi:hypothetical protein